MVSFMEKLQAQQNEMTQMLRHVVELETPTLNKAALDAFAEYLTTKFMEIGAFVEVLKQDIAGNHLRATWGEGHKQVLILGHMDTVWPLGEIERRPFKIKDGKAYGPGVFDMKGGLVQAFFALKAIHEMQVKLPYKVVFLCNSDEETGSGYSRAHIEAEAQKSEYVLVPEPAAGTDGAVKATRKGWGMYDMNVTGRASHSGNDHAGGINAIEELAHQVLRLQALTDYDRGTTVNVGVISGGNGYNVVPDWAAAKIDLRAINQQELLKAEQAILDSHPVLNGTTVSVTGRLNRPALEATPQNVQLYLKAKSIAENLGFDLPRRDVGGASDGNFTSALGIPTLDGIGVAGFGAHAINEHLILGTMAPRAALIAHLLIGA